MPLVALHRRHVDNIVADCAHSSCMLGISNYNNIVQLFVSVSQPIFEHPQNIRLNEILTVTAIGSHERGRLPEPICEGAKRGRRFLSARLSQSFPAGVLLNCRFEKLEVQSQLHG